MSVVDRLYLKISRLQQRVSKLCQERAILREKVRGLRELLIDTDDQLQRLKLQQGQNHGN